MKAYPGSCLFVGVGAVGVVGTSIGRLEKREDSFEKNEDLAA